MCEADTENLRCELKRKVQELEKEYESAKAARLTALDRENQILSALNGARQLLEYEQRQAGEQPENKPEAQPIELSKTRWIIRTVESSGEGLTAAKVHACLNAGEVKMSRQHVYNVLGRLRSEGRLERRGKSYFSIKK